MVVERKPELRSLGAVYVYTTFIAGAVYYTVSLTLRFWYWYSKAKIGYPHRTYLFAHEPC